MAGAIGVDRLRGALAHMLITDLSEPEIGPGKRIYRLAFGSVPRRRRTILEPP
jgi:hypothetical protein